MSILDFKDLARASLWGMMCQKILKPALKSVCCHTQKEVSQAKAKKAAEAEEAQRKIADIMVEAQKKVHLCFPTYKYRARLQLHILFLRASASTRPPHSVHSVSKQRWLHVRQEEAGQCMTM